MNATQIMERNKQAVKQEISKDRIIATLSWMIEHFKWAHEQTGIGGDYSDELKEAIELLGELNDENTAVLVGKKSHFINQYFSQESSHENRIEQIDDRIVQGN